MFQLLFSATGRLNRAKFWKGTLAVFVVDSVALIAFFVALAQIPEDTPSPTWSILAVGGLAILAIASFIAHIFLGIKRYHDHSKSGVWVLVQFVPAIGALWYFAEAGCMRGVSGSNQYGADLLGQKMLAV